MKFDKVTWVLAFLVIVVWSVLISLSVREVVRFDVEVEIGWFMLGTIVGAAIVVFVVREGLVDRIVRLIEKED